MMELHLLGRLAAAGTLLTLVSPVLQGSTATSSGGQGARPVVSVTDAPLEPKRKAARS